MAVPIFAAIAAAGAIVSVAQTVIKGAGDLKNAQGFINDEITVTVRGNKLSKKADLYKLAAALAFGQVQKGVAGWYGLKASPGAIYMENHLHDHSITFSLRYSRSIAAMMMSSAESFLRGTSTLTPSEAVARLPVFSGPEDNYVGGKWDFSSILTSAVDLPFAGKPILCAANNCADPDPTNTSGTSTLIPAPNPRPPGDLRSRGTLVSLVFAALSNPGSDDLMKMPTSNAISNASFTGGP